MIALALGWAWLTVSALTAASAAPSAIDAWLARQAEVRSWKAEFVQTRILPTLSEPLTARGRLWFAAPDQFRWELGQPPQTVAIRQPTQMFVIYPALKRAERYALTGRQNQSWHSALALLEAGFPRDRATLEAQFRILDTQQANGFLTVFLQPKSAGARRMIPRIQVVLTADDYSLRSTQLEFPDGSKMRNDFINAEVNPATSSDLFKPDFGSDYTLVEPLKDPPSRKP